MKSFAVLLILLACSFAFSQSAQPPVVNMQSQDESVSARQIVDLPLPKRGFKPKTTLQQALKIAEAYIKREKVDLSSYYLLEAKFFLYGDNAKEPRWSFVWLNSGPTSNTRGVDFRLTVGMNGKVYKMVSM